MVGKLSGPPLRLRRLAGDAGEPVAQPVPEVEGWTGEICGVENARDGRLRGFEPVRGEGNGMSLRDYRKLWCFLIFLHCNALVVPGLSDADETDDAKGFVGGEGKGLEGWVFAENPG